MIKIGDVIFVQNKGICKVENITKNAFVGCDKTKEYYVMTPVDIANNMMIYCPTDTKMKMRSLSSKSKAEKILKGFSSLSLVDVPAEEKRFEVYNEIAGDGDLELWCKLLKTLTERKNKVQKKQFNMQEQKYITQMTSCIVSELSYVLAKDKEEIKTLLFENCV